MANNNKAASNSAPLYGDMLFSLPSLSGPVSRRRAMLRNFMKFSPRVSKRRLRVSIASHAEAQQSGSNFAYDSADKNFA